MPGVRREEGKDPRLIRAQPLYLEVRNNQRARSIARISDRFSLWSCKPIFERCLPATPSPRTETYGIAIDLVDYYLLMYYLLHSPITAFLENRF